VPWTQSLATEEQKHRLSDAEIWGTGTVWVANNNIKQQLYREKVCKVQN